MYLDVEASVGIERINRNKETRQFDRLDQEKLEFHEAVRAAYLTLVAENPARITLIDASGTIEEVVAACLDQIKRVFPTKF